MELSKIAEVNFMIPNKNISQTDPCLFAVGDNDGCMNHVAENLGLVRERIDAATLRSGREAGAVTLVAVSKTWPVDHVQLAVDAGQQVLGENKFQEGQEKIPAMDPNLEWHYIGGLQRNKVRKVFGLFQNLFGIQFKYCMFVFQNHAEDDYKS